MNYKVKYILGSLISLPLLPLLYFQGKNIIKSVPKLPEAKEPIGFIDGNYKKDLNVLTIGESTIAGVGVTYHKNGFTGALAAKLSSEFKKNVYWRVYARSGYTVAQVCKKIIPKIKETKADVIVIGMGGNDAFKLNSPKKWNTSIAHLIYLLQSKFPGTPIFFTNMPPIKEFPAFTAPIKFVIGNLVEILGANLQTSIKNTSNVYYNNEIVTLNTWSKRHHLAENKPTMYFSDGVHPSELTYKVWGKEMGLFVKSKITL